MGETKLDMRFSVTIGYQLGVFSPGLRVAASNRLSITGVVRRA